MCEREDTLISDNFIVQCHITQEKKRKRSKIHVNFWNLFFKDILQTDILKIEWVLRKSLIIQIHHLQIN